MLIENLYQYAVENGLLLPFVDRSLAFRLNLDANGFVDLVKVDDTVAVPRTPPRGNKVEGYHLHDTPLFVFGRPDSDSDKHKKRAAVGTAAFWAFTDQILTAAGDEEALQAVQAAKADSSWIKKALKTVGDSKGFTGLAFEGTYLLDRPKVRAYLKRQFEKSCEEASGPDICMVTGKSCTAVRCHEAIKGVPGTGSGAALISFHMKSVCSPSFEQGDNYPMSYTAMSGYTSALNTLMETSSAIITTDQKKGGTCAVVWGPPEANAIAKVVNLFSNPEDRKAAWEVVEQLQTSTEMLHILFLKGSKGRIAILSYDLRPVAEVAKSLCRFREVFGDEASIASALDHTGSEKGYQPLSVPEKLAATRALLFGQQLPEQLISSLSGALNPKDVVNTERWAIKQLQWLDLGEVLGGDPPTVHWRTLWKKERMINEKPRIENYLNEPDVLREKDWFFAVGRLINLLIVVQRQALGREVPSSYSTQVNLAVTNTAAWLVDFGRSLDIYEDKLNRRRYFDRTFLKMALDLLGKLPPIEDRPLRSVREAASVQRGYYAQRLFATDYFAWKKAEREAKAAKAEESVAAE